MQVILVEFLGNNRLLAFLVYNSYQNNFTEISNT